MAEKKNYVPTLRDLKLVYSIKLMLRKAKTAAADSLNGSSDAESAGYFIQ